MQHAVAIAALSVTVSCEKWKKISVVSGIALTRAVRWKGEGSEPLEVQLSSAVLQVLSQFLVGFSQGPKLLLKPC